jgi:hypothetical protein
MRLLFGLLRWAGIALALFSIVALAITITAVPVVVDVAFGALVFSALAAALLVASHFGRRTSWTSALLLAGCLGVGAVSANLCFFTFDREEVRVRNGDVELAGTLYLPRSQGPHPVAVFLHGSGPQTRKEYAFYARLFARAGIAGLAYDKRGVGKSSGKLYGTDYRGYASDAVAAIRALRTRRDINPDAIGIVGFSEGEWTGTLATTQDGRLAFLVVVAASGTTPAEQVNAEIAIRLRARGHSEEVVARALTLNNRVFDYERTGEGAEELRAELNAAKTEKWFLDAKKIPSEVYPIEEYKWWRSVMDFDPRPIWEAVTAPVLVVKGGRDDRSPADVARRGISSALERGGNKSFEFELFPNADHAMVEWPLGNRIPPPIFTPGYLDTLVRWVRSNSLSADEAGAVR